jgi:hypothetical protein
LKGISPTPCLHYISKNRAFGNSSSPFLSIPVKILEKLAGRVEGVEPGSQILESLIFSAQLLQKLRCQPPFIMVRQTFGIWPLLIASVTCSCPSTRIRGYGIIKEVGFIAPEIR